MILFIRSSLLAIAALFLAAPADAQSPASLSKVVPLQDENVIAPRMKE